MNDVVVALPTYSKKEQIEYLFPEYQDDGKKMTINTKKIIGLDCDILNLRKELQEVEARHDKDIRTNIDKLYSLINIEKCSYQDVKKDINDILTKIGYHANVQSRHDRKIDFLNEAELGNLELIRGLQKMFADQQNQIILLQKIIKDHNEIFQRILYRIKYYGLYALFVVIAFILHFVKFDKD